MATIYFTRLDGAYNMLVNNLNYGVAGAIENGGDFSYGNALTPLDDIELQGTNLTYVGGASPVTGTINRIEMAIGNGNETNPDVIITDISVDAQLIGDSSSPVPHESMYRAILSGDTTFHFTGSSAGIVAFGDFFIADFDEVILRGNTTLQFRAGDDTFYGTGADNSFLRGDGETVANGASVTGGWDTFWGVFDWMYGDVNTVDGSVLNGGNDQYLETGSWTGDAQTTFIGDARYAQNSATVNGGDDEVVGATNPTTHTYDLFMDVITVSGASTVNGGDDTITANGTGAFNIWADATDVSGGSEVSGGNDSIVLAGSAPAEILADMNDVTGASTVSGGNDYVDLSATTGDNEVRGDAHSITDGASLVAGDDTLIGGSGRDTLDGDILYTSNDSGALVTAGDDLLIGGPGDDLLIGDIRLDSTAIGVYGDDTLIGGAGADQLFGNGGIDTADYSGSPSAVYIRLGNGSQSGGDAAGDVLLDIERIIGSDYGDILFGDHRDSTLDGGEGNDIMRGGEGVDVLLGADGEDVFWVAQEDLTPGDVYAGEGDSDIIYLKATYGTLDFREVSLVGVDRLAADNLWTGELVMQVTDLQMYLNFRESITLEPHAGHSFVLQVYLGDLPNTNTLDLSSRAMVGFTEYNDRIEIHGTTVDDVATASATKDCLFGFDGDDTLRGGDENDTLEGGADNDMLFGDGGPDTIEGGTGHDLLDGGAEGDWLIGGDGIDTVSYGSATERIVLDLSNFRNNTGDAEADTIESVEAYEGSSHDDVLLGDNTSNHLSGAGGQDHMRGRAGRDTLNGQDGDDYLNGGKGRDRLEGGMDDDRLFGSTGKDGLFGGRGNDVLEGGSGADNLSGGRDDDTLIGGTENDILTGGHGSDTFVFSVGDGSDIIVDFQSGADQISLDAALLAETNPVASDLASYASTDAYGFLVLTFSSDSITLNNVFSLDTILGDVVFV